MVCPKCGSNSINVQMVSETQLLTKHRGISGGFVLVGGGFQLNGVVLLYLH